MDKHKKLLSKENRPKYIISISISIIIILLTICNIVRINTEEQDPNHRAEKGVLDLRNCKIDEEKIIQLDGEWEFYSGVLLEPEEEPDDSIKQYVEVPGSWESYLNQEGSTDGSGTYRLIIKVPEDRGYGIKARTIRVANRIYLNGEEVAHAGTPSLDKKNAKAGSKYNLGMGNSLNQEIELIVQVTSYDYRTGGIIKSIELGSTDSIMLDNNRSRVLDSFVVSVCLVLGLYFLAMYFQRNKDPYLAYFSGINFFMGLYLSTMNEQILDLIYNYDFITRTRIQFLAMIMVTVCFLQFTYYFFDNYSTKKTTNKITGLMLIISIALLNNPEKPFSVPIGVTQAATLGGMAISYSYIFYVLIKNIYKRSDSLEYILVITSSMASYWFILALKIFLEIDLGNTPIILILFIVFSVASLMNHRLQLDHQESRDLSEKLIRYDRLKDEFLVKSSHELRMPLQIILNLTKTLLEGKKGVLNTPQQEDLFLIDQEGQRLIRLAEDLLDASLIKEGGIKLRLGPIEPYKTVEDILKEIEILVPHNDSILLRNQIPKEFPRIKADSDKFRQIVYDLVHNAIKYTRSGEICISASIVEGQAEIKVRDTGIGIEKKYLKEVFEIFYQKNEEELLNQGLGLGLSIVKHLVENQGGKIDVESVYGQGSSFRFTLPLYDENTEEDKLVYDKNNKFEINILVELASTVEKEVKNIVDQPTILIIDDELLNQRVLSDIVDRLEYKVIIANNGKEALDILVNNKIDLIILDFILPDMSGDQLCSQIRQEYSMVELPILILTASGRTIDLMSAFNHGVNDFQRKPVDSEELKSRIQSLLLMKTSADEGLEKEFQYFYSQISPHFLYNTLNSIIGLSYKDGAKARKALNNLSIYFRGKLDIHRKKGLVTLESELELVTAYLEIEEMRYGDRLEIEYDIEEGLDAMIPPLALQPIVENSVHHGLAAKENGGKIKISARKEPKDFISIVIEDNGKGMTFENQQELLRGDNKGIGFRNVVERIKILKGARLTLESKLEEGTKVKIVIPEVKQYESYFD